MDRVSRSDYYASVVSLEEEEAKENKKHASEYVVSPVIPPLQSALS